MNNRIAFPLVAFLSCWTAATAWNFVQFAPDQEADLEAQLIAIPRPEIARLRSLGFQAFAADVYWLLALQYAGHTENRQVAYKGLANYVELVNCLAPDFKEPYRFAGAVLPWPTGQKWENIEEAVAILERGVARFPDDWFMRLMLAYNYSSGLHRYKDAAKQLTIASSYPGAPLYFPKLAARLLVAAGDFTGARAFAERIAEEAEDPVIRDMMKRRAAEVATEEHLVTLKEAVSRFKLQTGRLPHQLDELVSAGVLQSIPDEPLGGRFLYNPENGTVESSSLRSRLVVFEQQR